LIVSAACEAVANMSAAKSKACAPLRAVAGGVSLASANLWPVYVGIKKGYIADVYYLARGQSLP
jgi:hypothetical protein